MGYVRCKKLSMVCPDKWRSMDIWGLCGWYVHIKSVFDHPYHLKQVGRKYTLRIPSIETQQRPLCCKVFSIGLRPLWNWRRVRSSSHQGIAW